MADKDTVSPYDDEVADPYAADDTKNPHEETLSSDEPEGDEETAEDETADPAPKKATRTTKAVKKA